MNKNEILKNLILFLKGLSDAKYFIETGTYYGQTTKWASDYFDSIHSIELSQKLYEKALLRLSGLDNVKLHNGNSGIILNEIIKNLNSEAIFWLDGHWSAGETAGEEAECPLILELDAINSGEKDYFILIDDARLFCSPPPKPHNPEHWPTIDEVIEKLKENRNYYIVIHEDLIIACPPEFKSELRHYLRSQVSK